MSASDSPRLEAMALLHRLQAAYFAFSAIAANCCAQSDASFATLRATTDRGEIVSSGALLVHVEPQVAVFVAPLASFRNSQQLTIKLSNGAAFPAALGLYFDDRLKLTPVVVTLPLGAPTFDAAFGETLILSNSQSSKGVKALSRLTSSDPRLRTPLSSEPGLMTLPGDMPLSLGAVVVDAQNRVSGLVTQHLDGSWVAVDAETLLLYLQSKWGINANRLAMQVKLRSTPRSLGPNELFGMLDKYGFSEQDTHRLGRFSNHLAVVKREDVETIEDDVTGLAWLPWHASEYRYICQSESTMGRNGVFDFDGAQVCIERLNRKRLGGFSDWRLPTIEELASLATPFHGARGFIDQRFGIEDLWYLSTDSTDSEHRWAIDYTSGKYSIGAKSGSKFGLMPVRSALP